MKKTFNSMITLMVITFFSCSNEEMTKEGATVTIKNKTNIEEIAFPNIPKEVVTLKNGMKIEKLDSLYILNEDMILTAEQVELLTSKPIETKGAITSESKYKWPDGIVYYQWGDISDETKEEIEQAMTAWTNATQSIITFKLIEGVPDETTSYVNYINGNGNYSSLGRRGGKQDLSVSLTGGSRGIAMHEIGHAVGLLHEQSRWDRDEYINIHWDNIIEGKKHNFDKYTGAHNVTGWKISGKEEFDFRSIMLYSSYFSFPIDETKPTMTTKDGKTWQSQRDGFTTYDIEAVYTLYGYPN